MPHTDSTHPHHSAHPEKRQSPIWLLIAATVAILIFLIWLGRDTSSRRPGFGGGLAGGVVEVSPRDPDQGAAGEQAGTGASGRQGRRSGGSSTNFLADRTIAGTLGDPDQIFPETEDYATSQPLELARELPPASLVGWVSDTAGSPITDATVTLEYEEAVPEGETAPKLTTTSNVSGLFEFLEIPPGRWTLLAEKEFYAKASVPSVAIEPAMRNGPLELQLGPELVLNGEVRYDRNPVAGARISIFRNQVGIHGGETFPLRIPYGSAVTDSAGKFKIEQLPPAELTIRVDVDSFARHEQTLLLERTGQTVAIALEPEALLSGFVRNEQGQPVSGAKVLLHQLGPPAKQPYAETTSREDGAFLFRRLPGNHFFNIQVKATGYADVGPIEVRSGSTTNIIILGTGGTITGSVKDFDTGQPVIGLRIVAESQNLPYPLLLSTKTNSLGEYRIVRLPRGLYNVVVSSDRLTSEPREGVNVPTNGTVRNINFTVYPGLTIEGTVVDGESRERIPNATVTLQSRVGPGLLTARNTNLPSDETGRFTFRNLPQGVYTLQASRAGYMAGAGDQASRRVELLRGVNPAPVEIPLFPGGMIEGTVTDRTGAAVDNAVVQLYHASGTPSRINVGPFTTRTGVSGRFVMEGIPIHNEVHLQISAVADGHAKSASAAFILNNNQRFVDVPVTLSSGGTMDIEVSDTEGSGISRARVNLSHNGFPGDPNPGNWVAETDHMGRARFVNVPRGRATVSVSKDGYLGGSAWANVVDDGFHSVSVSMEKAISMSGRVIDDRGSPIHPGRVVLSAESGSRGGGAVDLRPDGSFEIKTLGGQGTFSVEVDARPGTSSGGRRILWTHQGIAPNTGIGDVVLEVPSHGTVEGTVTLPLDVTPPTRYQVNVRGNYIDSSGRRRAMSASHNFDWGLPFSMTRLPPGVYSVQITAPDFLPVESSDIIVSSPGVFSVGDLRLAAGGKVRARVLNDRTGEPINGATIRLVPDGPSARTNNNGIAVISPVSPAIYKLEVRHADFLDRDVPLIQVTRLRETDAGDIALSPGAILFGRVVDGLGDPLRGILVEVRPADPEQPIRTARTDAGGRYRFNGLKPGGVLTTFSGTVNRRSLSQSTDVSLTVTRPNELNVTLNANSRIEGTMLAPPEVHVDRAVVTAYPVRRNGLPIINESAPGVVHGSRFEVDNLAYGLYLVTVQAPLATGGTVRWEVEVVVDQQVNVVFVEAGRMSFVGRILDSPGGRPVARQPVRFELLTSGSSGVTQLRNWWQWNVTTNANGFFRIDYLPRGTYSLIATNANLGGDILEILNIRESSRYSDRVIDMEFYFDMSLVER